MMEIGGLNVHLPLISSKWSQHILIFNTPLRSSAFLPGFLDFQ